MSTNQTEQPGSEPAFPQADAQGMSIRTYIATHIAAAIVATDPVKNLGRDSIADEAVIIADELIERLAK